MVQQKESFTDMLKFIYYEKATKFCEISTVDLSYVVPIKSMVEISQNFVAFSEYMNFIALQTFVNSIPTYCTDDIVKNTGETREDQNSVKKVPITRHFYHSQKVPPHWDGAF